MNQSQHLHHTVQSQPQNAIDTLFEISNLTKAELKLCFSRGAVWLSSAKQKPVRLRRVKKSLKVGDRLDLYYNPDVLHSQAPVPTLMLDRTQYSVWFKPRGMLSQGSKWADHSALYRWVEMNHRFADEQQNRQAWLVHRLDRATAGLQLLAHSKKMAQTLGKLFETQQIKKRYQAIVHGQFPHERQSFHTQIDDKAATTHAQCLQFNAQHHLSLLEIEIESGRKHQIRKHLSQAGFPIVGDRLYGDETRDHDLGKPRPNLQLTAYRLQFTCPISQQTIDIELSRQQLDLLDLHSE